jgi:hypothetical protein
MRVFVLTCVCLTLVGCSPDDPLTDGAAWVTRDVPPALEGKVSRYEQTQVFGEGNDPHGWRQITRYTMRADVPGPTAGCSFTGWIPGTWSRRGDELVIITSSADSGSLEQHACPDGSAPTTVARARHFVRAVSTFRLEGRTLHLDRAFDEAAPRPVVLTRAN